MFTRQKIYENLKKIYLFLGILAICICVLPIKVQAANNNDGLNIVLKTDKKEYTTAESIEATLFVENTNKFDVADILLEQNIPNGYRVSDGVVVKNIGILPAGETTTLTVTYEPNNDKNDEEIKKNNSINGDNGVGKNRDNKVVSNDGLENSSPSAKTGDDSHVALYLVMAIIASVIIIYFVRKKKKGKKFLSLILSLIIISTLISTDTVYAQTASQSKTTDIQTTVKVGEKDVTLSAQVTYAIAEKENPSKNATVTFDLNYDNEGIYTTTKVSSGSVVSEPDTPIRDGYVFDGWYDLAKGGQEFNFDTPITENIILYAHWSTAVAGDGTYSITFDKNDGSSGVYQTQMLNNGETVNKPQDPERDMYRFTGWYLESAAITEYDFALPVTGDLTLYAGWGNPDGSNDSLYAATDKLETINSITDVEVDEDSVAVTYNTNSQCLITVEFYEDLMSGSDWSEEAQNANLDTEPVAVVSGYTTSYGELVTLTLPIDEELPEDFVVRAMMYGTGESENPSYVSNHYTATYKQFEAKTVEDEIEEYGSDRVLNFDNDKETNFGVLKDSVKILTVDDYVNGFEVTDIENEGDEDEVVPDHEFNFMHASRNVRNLQPGDVVYLEDTTWLFKIKTADCSWNGTVTLTQDKEASMVDFYDVLQVDMAASDADDESSSVNEEGIEPEWEIIDVDANLSASFNPSISHEFSNGIKISGNLIGKITGQVEMSYDAKLFAADYFECSVSFVTETSIEVKAEVSNDNTNEWQNVVYQFDTRKISLPTPITGLEVYAKPSAKIDWSLTAEVGLNAKATQTSGFKYNSDTGRKDIKKKEVSVSLMAKGEAEAKVGPNIDIGVQLLGGVLDAGVTAEAGAKFTATAETGADDFTNNVDSKHACGLCVSGKARWYATAAVKCGWKITDSLKGDIAKLTILDIESAINFIPKANGEFFVSVINSLDSPFKGEIRFGGGPCTNKTYRTEIQVLNESGQQIEGTQIEVVKSGQAFKKTGTSAFVVYLYEGTYNASTSIDGTSVSKMFVVSDNRQIVALSRTSADSVLEGTIVEASDHSLAVESATIKISKDGIVIASVKSDDDGKFNVAVPDGSIRVEISKEGYVKFTSIEDIYAGEKHSMGLIEMTAGSGMGGFHGKILDAVEDTPLSDVTLNLYEGWNSSANGSAVLRTLSTDENGEFRYETVTMLGKTIGLTAGNYTLTASKEGYADTSYNIVVYPGTTDENPEINETMSPEMNEGYYRIILTWGETPSDLDSHLTADIDDGSGIHVYYSNKNPSPYYSNLDTDDTSSYGPETITITNFDGLSDIHYAVHDYTNRSQSSSTALSYSGAKVRIFKGNKLLRTFEVPVGYGGTEWDVFSMDSTGHVKNINTMTYTSDPTSVLSGGINTLNLDDEIDSDNSKIEASGKVSMNTSTSQNK